MTTLQQSSHFVKEEERLRYIDVIVNSLKADVSIWEVLFGWARLYWNGIVNGYKKWDKDYVIGDWCKLQF